jgi:lantibiotic modifying enzyme
LLIFLLDYYNHKGLKSLELPIHRIVQQILKSSIRTSQGVTWQSEKFKKLVGFAHGNAGFLYSLSKYYGTFGYTNNDIKFIEDIIHYNNSYFSNYQNGWRDLRYSQEMIAAPSWCHGSSGILLAYLETQNQLSLKFDIDWNEVSNTIIQKGFNSSHCLCHGMVGNAEALIAIGNYMNNPNLKSFVHEKILSEIQKNQNEFNWRTGFTNGRFALNGLFLGTSGIAYNLLKIFVNPNLPSFLILQSPILRNKKNYIS